MRVICISDTGDPTGGGNRLFFYLLFLFRFVVLMIKGRYILLPPLFSWLVGIAGLGVLQTKLRDDGNATGAAT
ncbi:hypothetical protein F5B18DRAFT_611495 [Nemania serpens]|nr:hypothetical protein F5B18DRAFT_611495 [Nemania serpens]